MIIIQISKPCMTDIVKTEVQFVVTIVSIYAYVCR